MDRNLFGYLYPTKIIGWVTSMPFLNNKNKLIENDKMCKIKIEN